MTSSGLVTGSAVHRLSSPPGNRQARSRKVTRRADADGVHSAPMMAPISSLWPLHADVSQLCVASTDDVRHVCATVRHR